MNLIISEVNVRYVGKHPGHDAQLSRPSDHRCQDLSKSLLSDAETLSSAEHTPEIRTLLVGARDTLSLIQDAQKCAYNFHVMSELEVSCESHS